MAQWCSLLWLYLLATTCALVVSEEYFDLMNTGAKEWRLAFRGTNYVRSSVYLAYLNGTGIPQNNEPGCTQPPPISLPCHNHYRNSEALDNWAHIAEVAFVIYSNNAEVKRIIFDARGTNMLNWFQQSKIKSSTWPHLKTERLMNFFAVAGDNNLKRHFFINRQYGGCPNDCGWFVAIDINPGACSWEMEDGLPVFKYSKTDNCVNWTTGDFGRADVIAIFLKYDTDQVIG